jgi:hypothetical protein
MNDTSTLSLINQIFCLDAPLSKDQHLDLHRSSKALIPEVSLWLSILQSVYDDWCAYAANPVINKRKVRDIYQWGFKEESFNLDQISDAVYIAYRIEPEIFKLRFRVWLHRTKPPKFTSFVLTEPFESVIIPNEFDDAFT